ncbi:ferritin heavy polypeptide-like 17 [Sorex fumeus]|uniref:ferritin heavy polypeptide-like 17 n=1 Tax=Sorex fumeus TaxID=62283 RepID=UPI0024ADA4D3|nr:ferritin heavy polypeptide-like 17 [Sorex fumeus]
MKSGKYTCPAPHRIAPLHEFSDEIHSAHDLPSSSENVGASSACTSAMVTLQLSEILQNYALQCDATNSSHISGKFNASYGSGREADAPGEPAWDLPLPACIQQPAWEDWKSGLQGKEHAFILKKNINQEYIGLHQMASNLHENHHCAFLESHFLLQKVQAIKELAYHFICQHKMASPDAPMSHYILEHLLLGEADRKD